jgi:hypothetical protein
MDDWSREVVIPTQIGRHAVVVGEAEDPSDFSSTHQVLGVDHRRHFGESIEVDMWV